MIKQISMFLKNQPGELAKIMTAFEEDSIKIIAMCITDTNENGIFRVIVDKPIKAQLALKKIKVNTYTSRVLIVEITEIKKLFIEMNANKLNVEYMYSLDLNNLVIKFDDLEKGYDILFKLGYKLLAETDIFMEESNEN
ncbi:MAG: hypothetical protein PHQ32_01465 [Firmicutes bacterium]|nr:hypothetical protein [Bacillota bacterium]